MKTRFLTVLTITLTLAVVALSGVLYWVLLTRTPTPTAPFRADAPSLAQPGPYGAGTTTTSLPDAERPLDVWLWYPTAGEPQTESVHTYTSTFGVWASFGYAVPEAAPTTDGPFPLVVLSHGSGGTPLMHLNLVETLATHGYVVIATEHPGNYTLNQLQGEDTFDANLLENYIRRPQDIVRLLDAAEQINVEQGNLLTGLIDMEQVAIAGHSFGGYTAFAAAGVPLNTDALADWCAANEDITLADVREPFAYPAAAADESLGNGTCYLLPDVPQIAQFAGYDTPPSGAWDSLGDERIDAIVAFAPWNAPIFGEQSLNTLQKPLLVFVGSADIATEPERDADNFYAWTDSDQKALVTFRNGDHYLYLDECPPLLTNLDYQASCTDSVWDLTRAHDITNHLTVSFLHATFADDEAAAANLPDADFLGVSIQTEGF